MISVSARQRWTLSHYIRTSIISDLFESLGITKKEDVTKESKLYYIYKNSEVVEKVLSLIENTINPFQVYRKEMHNIDTRAAPDKETALFLLSFQEIGASANKKCVLDCIKDPANFEKPIKKQSYNICDSIKEYKMKGNEKGELTAMMHDLFGSILVLSLQKKKLTWRKF